MEKLKKQKIQEILDQQNAAIDVDMVCLFYKILDQLNAYLLHLVYGKNVG